MVTSSGYFVPLEPQAATPGEDLELMYESKDGPCQLLKGHKNDRIVVYKVLKPAFRDEPVYQRLLRREYEIGASLTHPGVCQTLGWTRLPEYGEAIELDGEKGWTLVLYHGMPLGWGKRSGSTLKNHLPKRLRRQNYN